MGKFNSIVGFKPHGKKSWCVGSEFSWRDQKGNILVPKNFVFDAASVPWGITLFFPRSSPRYIQAAALHDYMIIHLRHLYTRKEIDDIFRDALISLNNHPITVNMMYAGVKTGGYIKDPINYNKLLLTDKET